MQFNLHLFFKHQQLLGEINHVIYSSQSHLLLTQANLYQIACRKGHKAVSRLSFTARLSITFIVPYSIIYNGFHSNGFSWTITSPVISTACPSILFIVPFLLHVLPALVPDPLGHLLDLPLGLDPQLPLGLHGGFVAQAFSSLYNGLTVQICQ